VQWKHISPFHKVIKDNKAVKIRKPSFSHTLPNQIIIKETNKEAPYLRQAIKRILLPIVIITHLLFHLINQEIIIKQNIMNIIHYLKMKLIYILLNTIQNLIILLNLYKYYRCIKTVKNRRKYIPQNLRWSGWKGEDSLLT